MTGNDFRLQTEKRIKELEEKLKLLSEGRKSSSYRQRYSVQEFKLIFKVGDYLTGWSTGKTVCITAIGEKRFLAKDLCLRKEERVCSIEGGTWAKVSNDLLEDNE